MKKNKRFFWSRSKESFGFLQNEPTIIRLIGVEQQEILILFSLSETIESEIVPLFGVAQSGVLFLNQELKSL